jgi:hypothetical protein
VLISWPSLVRSLDSCPGTRSRRCQLFCSVSNFRFLVSSVARGPLASFLAAWFFFCPRFFLAPVGLILPPKRLGFADRSRSQSARPDQLSALPGPALFSRQSGAIFLLAAHRLSLAPAQARRPARPISFLFCVSVFRTPFLRTGRSRSPVDWSDATRRKLRSLFTNSVVQTVSFLLRFLFELADRSCALVWGVLACVDLILEPSDQDSSFTSSYRTFAVDSRSHMQDVWWNMRELESCFIDLFCVAGGLLVALLVPTHTSAFIQGY